MKINVSVDLDYMEDQWGDTLPELIQMEAEAAIKNEIRKIAREWAKQHSASIQKEVKSLLTKKAKVTIE